MRVPIIAANWKMNKTIEETMSFAEDLLAKDDKMEGVEVIIAPPFTALSTLNELLSASKIRIAAQNIHFEKRGAFTGEISAEMASEVCSYVILGHSERRHVFGEDNEIINKKVRTALSMDVNIILCVGETLEERKGKKTVEIVEEQVKKGLEGIEENQLKRVVIAYEPVWAIGTGVTATPEQAEGAHAYIRDMIKKLYSLEAAQQIRIIYGGSVKPENVKSIMEQYDVDGALVGGASLDVESFYKLIKYDS